MTDATTTTDAPVTPASAFDDVITSTLESSGLTGESSASDQGDRHRDEKGRFVAQQESAEPTPAQDTPDPATPETPEGEPETDGNAVAVPDGYTLPATLPPERSSFFVVKDAEGEIAAPDLTWEINAGGKTRTLSTDKLVQYAQNGVYNHEREQAYQAAQAQAHELTTSYQDLEQRYQERERQIERLLSDPDYLVQAIQDYERYNTPEAQAERARQELEQTRQQQQLQQLEQQAEAFVTNELDPAVQQIAAALPTVGFDELAARLFIASQRYRGADGVLRPEGFQPLQQYILSDLVPWAKQVHEARSSEREQPKLDADKAKAKAEADAKAAQIRAQRKIRQASLATKPVAGNRAMPDTPSPKPIRNLKDAENDIVSSVLAGVGGA